MEHLHFKHYDEKRQATYNIDMFQSAFDVITVAITDIAFYNGTGYAYIDIPVKKAQGFSWKCNKTSVSCDTGNAADLIKLFKEFDAYAKATVRTVCFENQKNRKKIA